MIVPGMVGIRGEFYHGRDEEGLAKFTGASSRRDRNQTLLVIFFPKSRLFSSKICQYQFYVFNTIRQFLLGSGRGVSFKLKTHSHRKSYLPTH